MYPADTLFRAIAWRAAGGAVAAGPFAGLRLAPHPFLPHLLGSYERELHPTIESLATRAWDTVINVGGGNGFYIAGLGRRLAHARLIVFELTAEARAVIAATVALNGLAERTTVLGAADPGNLGAACANAGRLLVVIDVEGYERELLDPAHIPALRTATILVETHDVIVPGCRAAIESRFAATHAITVIPTQPRTMADFPTALAPSLARWMPAKCVEAVQEWRGGSQEWLVLEPRKAEG